MTLTGFERILAAAFPSAPPERVRFAAELVREYARGETEVGPLEARARAVPPSPLEPP